jgi:hypothetical protein
LPMVSEINDFRNYSAKAAEIDIYSSLSAALASLMADSIHVAVLETGPNALEDEACK